MRTIYCYCKAFLINMLLMPLVMIFFLLKGPLNRECLLVIAKIYNYMNYEKDLTELESDVIQLVERIENSKFERNGMFIYLASKQLESKTKSFTTEFKEMFKIDREIYESCQMLSLVAHSFDDEIPELSQLLMEENQNTESHKINCKQLNFKPRKLSSSFATFLSKLQKDSDIHVLV